MAKRTTASNPARQLGELLQEQQEPFILEVYLSERGCVRKNLTSGANFIGCHGNSGKFLKKFGSQNQSKKGIPHFPKLLKVVLCNKFFKIKGLRTKNSDDEDGKPSTTVTEMGRNNQETAEPDRFSSASCTTVYNSCSDSDIDESSMFADSSKSDFKLYNERENKVAADTKFQWSCMEDSKQNSPQSVLEEILSTSTSSPLDNTRRVSSARQKSLLPKLITEDSILSTSLWNLLLKTTAAEKSSCAGLTEELQEPDRSNNSSPFSISKRVLQQTKQLLLDCVRELVDKHEKEEKGKEFLGSEEIGKLICEKIKGWGIKRCGDESNLKQLLEIDVMESTKEWNDFESQKKNIGLVIGNAIAEEITNEVVMDMMTNVL
ncbi:hypothetical protein REPUB_Repub19eG0060100 [Reevesia pubescens]